jgi:hypothetical protein
MLSHLSVYPYPTNEEYKYCGACRVTFSTSQPSSMPKNRCFLCCKFTRTRLIVASGDHHRQVIERRLSATHLISVSSRVGPCFDLHTTCLGILRRVNARGCSASGPSIQRRSLLQLFLPFYFGGGGSLGGRLRSNKSGFHHFASKTTNCPVLVTQHETAYIRH